MSDKNLKALNNVLKKLSAVRTTLSDEEQVVLDQLVLNTEEDDVTGHMLQSKAISTKAVTNAPEEEEDVSAHSMVQKASTQQRLNYKINQRISLSNEGEYQVQT